MLMTVTDVLDGAAVADLRRDLANVEFCDGRSSAGFAARTVKHNAQAAPDPAADLWRDRIAASLLANALVQLAARPKRIIGPVFSRYRAGERYGVHVDEPIMDGARVDLSFTLFLADPHDYEGGELVIESAAGEDAHKPPAGSLVLYPTTSLHRVNPVVSGERLAAVGWIRSFVRDAAQRELLFDLDTVRHRMFQAYGKSADFDLLSKCSANLSRMWADD